MTENKKEVIILGFHPVTLTIVAAITLIITVATIIIKTKK